MKTAILAFGAISALGEGQDALGLVPVGRPAERGMRRDAELERAALLRPFCARADGAGDSSLARAPGEPDRATALLSRAFEACARELDALLPEWRAMRVGLAIGTSSGGMRTFEDVVRDTTSPPSGEWFEGTYFGPVVAAQRPCTFEPSALVLGACASSTIALGLGRAWLDAGHCDLVFAGGFDAVSVFVASGFEVLRATASDGLPRPFREGRDGLALGEGVGIAAMVPASLARSKSLAVRGFVTGFGASCDAVHLTAPDRTGAGLARAATQALADAGNPPIDLVSAHGTATDFNDASETQALAKALGDRASKTHVHAFKSVIGHTLGAAGVLEALSALEAMRAGVALPSAGEGKVLDGIRIGETCAAFEGRTALKLSAAFGGANAAIVLACDDVEEREKAKARDVYVSRASLVDRAPSSAELAQRTGYAEDRIARGDDLVRLAMGALALLDEALRRDGKEGLGGAGIVVGHGLATIDTNALYQARVRTAGASRGEPRRFPYTTPNAAAGECAIAFGLTGPAFAVGGGPHGGLEALAVAADLVRTRVADRIVVVAVDEAGAGSRHVAPETAPGAVALLVSAEPLAARLTSCAVRLDPNHASQLREASSPSAIEAHRGLRGLASATPPEELEVVTAWGFAKAGFFWL
ncbi:3-oxoacyl-[acyl-carrier-protein] synthase, KASII [Labilithrix luteola]|uniref:3-oxoacyl-[acyl-carrier-protein] synthase, KASII n=1 Tax=Labilithrix luteola TaxID=1391654 RepID=A0A0K1Q7Q6_9BACT|nr:beta-ketoacyl synthase N-terminal-like domain-containing protein [Labilithrix luteola]AKV01773.1 3-oxoacyl-[acyl-carrier-protein] synthase, KASII [Labilithrix luteola]